MLKLLIKIRRKAGGPVANVARALHVHGPLLRLYDRLRDWSTGPNREVAIKVAGRTARFHLTSRAESLLVDHWEMRQIERLAERLRPGDVFYDIGANLGLFSCCLGVVGGNDLTIHAFEPVPMNAGRLRENLELNGLQNAGVHQVALSDARDEMTMFTKGEVGTPTSSLVRHQHDGPGEQGHEIVVDVYPPVDYASEHDIPPPSVLKCDVEGAEGAVLRAMREWLETGTIRVLVVEYHPDALTEQGDSQAALEDFVEDMGFEPVDRVEHPGNVGAVEVLYERAR